MNSSPTVAGRREPLAHPMALAIPRVVVLVIAAYIAAQMIADVASTKIGLVLGLSVDMGTFIYPITFTLRDLAHKTMGKKNTQVLIVAAAGVNLFMALYLLWSASVPAGEGFQYQEAFTAVLGPLWRIVLASIVAEVVSELVDTEVYHWFVTRITTSYQWARVLVSNSVSIPIDNLIFTLGAFAALPGLQDHFLTQPWGTVGQIFLFNLAVKYGVTLFSLPLIYLTPDAEWRER